ncbi:DUF721 domain-containing protein [Parvularcula sp. LCG005]|uniref:DUF721 domain-containing protein n=1 Tax=Parvularcula sp. LCG005 TaxID=3078805 RepID=UPI00294245E4|nr:DUF721 domain-containing protein [Parvularcula sp. LCG005]WOI52831.1 DUF721 domain-containing protein [Parvularcula sp. LCG005]
MSNPPVNTKPVRSAPPKVSRSVAQRLAALAKASGALDPELVAGWQEIAGEDMAKVCRPVRLKKAGKSHTLVVSVPSGAAAMKVQYSQAAILARASAYLRLPGLKKLVIEQSGTIAKPEAKRARWASRTYTASTVPREEPVAQPPARDLDEALRRLRLSMQERRNAP